MQLNNDPNSLKPPMHSNESQHSRSVTPNLRKLQKHDYIAVTNTFEILNKFDSLHSGASVVLTAGGSHEDTPKNNFNRRQSKIRRDSY